MAFLIPENVPSRSDLPERLQVAARYLRDVGPDEVTVWLEEDSGGHYLLVLDPAVGIVAITAPSVSGGGLAQRFRGRSSDDAPAESIAERIQDRVAELEASILAEERIDALPVGFASAVPGLTRGQAAERGADDAVTLTKEDFESGEALRAALRRILRIELSEPLTDLGERIVRGIVRPDIIISGAENNGRGQLVFRPPEVAPEDVIRVMDREQERLARHLGGGYRVIRGVAGSGKTLVLTYRAKYFAEHFPNRRVLLVCFNIVLMKALEKELRPFPSVDVKTVDGLAYAILSNGTRLPQIKTSEEFTKRRVDAAKRAKANGSAKYDVVLVDEAQDLDTAGLELAYSVLKDNREEFVIALDGAQNIYRKRLTWNPPGMTARGRTSVLRVNYRNTREILDFAVRFLTRSDPDSLKDTPDADPNAIVPPEAASRSGPWPKVLVCADQKSEATQVAKEVRRLLGDGVDQRSIAVLYGNRAMQQALHAAFKAADLPYFCVTFNNRNKRQAVAVNDVRSSTVQGMKGLEFSRVFMCGVNDVWLPDKSDDSVHRLLYVGMTRAMDELTITVSGSGPIGRELTRL